MMTTSVLEFLAWFVVGFAAVVLSVVLCTLVFMGAIWLVVWLAKRMLDF